MEHETEAFADEAIPYEVVGVEAVGSLVESFGDLPADTRSGREVTVAGRLMRFRRQGRLAFGDLVDSSGKIQLLLRRETAADFDRFVHQRVLGDWISVNGEVMTSRSGELSIEVVSWQLLAHARRNFGDKWRGISDPDTRYRQRYVDLWANPEVRERLKLRSRIVAQLRSDLGDRGFMEVETPILQPIASGAIAKPFVTHHNALDTDFFLRIAPELYLKRLVVGGFERVFELGRDFRNEGLSPRHNPEFSMLEVYQAYTDVYGMIELTETLISHAALAARASLQVSCQGQIIDLAPPYRRATMEELVSETLGQPVLLEHGRQRLADLAAEHGVKVETGDGPGRVLFSLYEALVESALVQPTFVLDFPKEVSPLARDHRDPSKPGRVEQFDLVILGREIGTAYSELNDPDEQRRRFYQQAQARLQGDEEAMVLDEDFLRALEHGMPPTGGLGIGVDRLVILLTDAPHIKEVIAFPALRPESL
ncbi:lysine--tRNA ligase [Ferrimicrobium acidiphilum]|jgi:lysyl-tRNA synthetase class 2|uniref:Lysine--tRNA ligase n=1 Tax=Ferrimicrobium acidiphilum DSM 19497 TaxID=1121877 RepID=A0A0D8FV51_9ACTN|nr:lysine--tRNA ligase [Ferrimicrobium acidiphilum]KJE76986.1 lysine--tRNA ligase [Ferrimicrobium acidiphilum DSM 19497]